MAAKKSAKKSAKVAIDGDVLVKLVHALHGLADHAAAVEMSVDDEGARQAMKKSSKKGKK